MSITENPLGENQLGKDPKKEELNKNVSEEIQSTFKVK